MIKQEIKKIIIDNDPVFENDKTIGVRSDGLSKNILVGSYVIIPKSQVSSSFELTEKEWNDTFSLLIEIKKYLDEKYSPDGYNLGWNVGKVAGQNVAHAHMHVLPRYENEPLAGKGIRFMFKNAINNKDLKK